MASAVIRVNLCHTSLALGWTHTAREYNKLINETVKIVFSVLSSSPSTRPRGRNLIIVGEIKTYYVAFILS